MGAFIFLCMMCFGIAGISFGGSLFPWGSAATIVLIVLGVVFFGIFIAQQALCLGTTHANRLFPAQYFRRRTHALLWFLTALTAASLFVPVYFIPLFAQFTRGASALDAAVRLLPFLFMLVLFSLVQGAVMSKEGHYVPWYLFAAAVTLSGSALMATVDENTPDARLYGYSAFLAMGAGTVVQTGFVVAQATTPRAEMPSCTSSPSPDSRRRLHHTSNADLPTRSRRVHQRRADRRHGPLTHDRQYPLPQPGAAVPDRRAAWRRRRGHPVGRLGHGLGVPAGAAAGRAARGPARCRAGHRPRVHLPGGRRRGQLAVEPGAEVGARVPEDVRGRWDSTRHCRRVDRGPPCTLREFVILHRIVAQAKEA